MILFFLGFPSIRERLVRVMLRDEPFFIPGLGTLFVRHVIPRARRWMGSLGSSNDFQIAVVFFRIGRTACKAFYAFFVRASTREQYIYMPLSNSSDSSEIRLIKLHPGSGDDPLRVDILHASLDSDLVGKYEAVSYAWEDGHATKKLETQRGALLITPSLFHALHRFRSKDEPRMLWADAVCINQSNNAEKASQVALMNEIYASAACTLVYLGREADGSEIVGELLTRFAMASSFLYRLYGRDGMEMLRDIGSIPAPMRQVFEVYKVPGSEDPAWKALARLWARPWFRRVWVIQEFVLSPDVRMFCGEWEVSWSVFYVATIDAYMTFSFSVLPDVPNAFNDAAKHMGTDAMHMMCEYRRSALLKTLPVSDADSMRMLTINLDTMVFQEQEEFNLARNMDPKLRLRVEVPLLDLLALCDRSKATRARDHLFAVLGLSNATDDDFFQADYSSKFDEIVRRFGKALVRRGQCMDLVYQARLNIQSSRFPSWIPDWTTKFIFMGDEIVYSSLGLHSDGLYAAGGDTQCVPWVSDDPKDDCLTVRGRFVDRLSWVGGDHVKHGPIHGLIRRLQQSYDIIAELEKTSDYLYVTGESLRDVWWRMLVANKTKEFRPVSSDFGIGLRSRWNAIPFLCNFLLSSPPEEAKEQLVKLIGLPCYQAIYSCYTVYQIAKTDKGMIGLVPLLAEAGDEIYVLNGGAVPFILRRGKRLLNGRRQSLTMARFLSSVALLSLIAQSHGHPCDVKYPPQAKPVETRQFSNSRGAVASESSICSTIGIDILRQGGNAADAMVATVLCVGTVGMYHSGIGGGGFMLIHKPDGKNESVPYEFVDFRETAPAAATENMFKNNVNASIYGGQASGVPGELRGLEHLHKTYGHLPWSKLVQPAIDVARYGFPVNNDTLKYMKMTYSKAENESFLLSDPAWAIDFAPAGRLVKFGEKLTRKRYADTLETIASKGAGAFYEGSIADATIRTLKQKKGIMTTDDLKNYSVAIREPSQINYRGGKITSGSAPSSGAVVAAALNVLDGYDFLGDPRRVNDSAYLLDEAFKSGYGMRSNLGDPSFVKGLGEYQAEMYSNDTAQEIRAKLDGRALAVKDYDPKGLESLDTPGTSHIVTMDNSGLSISLTTTINLNFGSQVIVPETGVIMNNEMNDFSIPGQSNAFGFIPSEANFIRPGKRPLSSISTTIVEGPDGKVSLVTGSAGGSRIITATVQVVLNALEKNMTVHDALAAPRLHDQLEPRQVTFEYAYDNSTVAYLKEIGNNVTWVAPGQSTAQALRRLLNGTFEAAGEPRQANSGGFST
ncbi:heterokaryon incompatibility (het-6OR allele) [Fusarium circinatum]|uniref:Glutathione hydrolase n=1 Tax=Fusarium circinatum TaxID=48490 RepID=A0A8H5U9Z6_FUSCI|nr:heterokaryon incompatibility (het-6OR allele) [Fusarium circinatum]